MDSKTLGIKEWLDKRFSLGVKEGKYFAHQPIYGYEKGFTEGRDMIRYARTLSILETISHFNFKNFIDIGGAEGYVANLVKRIFKIDSYASDLSFEASLRARELFGIDSIGSDSSNLPFKNESFDMVLCSEVIEHIVNPIQTICELKRITKKALLITTEAICYDKFERKLRMLLVDLREPHGDRNWYLINDFITILGKEIRFHNTVSDVASINKRSLQIDKIKNILIKYNRTKTFTRDGLGISILFIKDKTSIKNTPETDVKGITDTLLNSIVDLRYPPKIAIDKYPNKVFDFLCCPKCNKSIKQLHHEFLVCSGCDIKYKIEKGIPLLYTRQKDMEFIRRKWSLIYKSYSSADYEKIMQLDKLFKHNSVYLNNIFINIFIKPFIYRILKVKKFFNNCCNVMKNGTIKDLLSHLIKQSYRKINKELKRIINK